VVAKESIRARDLVYMVPSPWGSDCSSLTVDVSATAPIRQLAGTHCAGLGAHLGAHGSGHAADRGRQAPALESGSWRRPRILGEGRSRGPGGTALALTDAGEPAHGLGAPWYLGFLQIAIAYLSLAGGLEKGAGFEASLLLMLERC